jgi:Cu2+-containing amine oxidase
VKWAEADRSIESTDIVFLYTFGHAHVPRPEDWRSEKDSNSLYPFSFA